MNKELQAIIPFLDPKCHLFAEMQVSDHQAHSGIPMRHITDQLGHQMGHHISEKLPLVMQRTSQNPYSYSASTAYRAELFVFTEAELLKLVERVQNNTYNTKVEAFKKSTKQKVNKIGELTGELYRSL